MKPTVIATIVCLIAAVSEALVTGSDPRSRFRRLRLPCYSPAFRIWILIGLFYYVMCFVILRHLLSAADFSGLHRSALVLVIALTVLMIPIYAFGGVLLSAYCGYLVYATCWSYRLWQLNDPKH